jgi:parallel beta-helix repeat protein
LSAIAVDSTSALNAALSAAQSGDTILLRAGTYSGLNLSNLSFSSAVTIASADPAHHAVLTNFDMTAVDGLIFSQVELFAQQPNFVGFNVYSSQNITYDRVSVHGTLDGNASNDPEGIRVYDSSHINLTNSEFQQLADGFSVTRSSDIVISGNTIHNMESDGLDFSQVANLKVMGNILYDFHPVAGDHPDAIQFMTVGTTVASHDITVSDNLIYRGAGDYAQGVFMSDEVETLPFQHVTISDNVIVGTGYSAIRPTHNTDLTISGNTLVSLAGDNNTYLLVQNSDHVVSANNKATSISIDSSSNVSETADVLGQVVSDSGAAVVELWLAAHPPITPSTFTFSPSESASFGGSGDDTVTGTATSNYLRGDAGDDVIDGGPGFNDMNGNQGNDTIHGGSGDNWAVGGRGNDLLFGGGGTNLILGNLGNDTLHAGAGDDVLRGGQGDDVIFGGPGHDWISGDLGNNTETGGTGADTFHSFGAVGLDLVTNFSEAKGDHVLLDPGTQYSVSQVGANTVISMVGGGQMILAGVQLSSLHSGWLIGA